MRAFNWRLRGRRPARLKAFSEQVLNTCTSTATDFVLSTGLAPIDAAALDAIGRLGVRRLNYLTDDPFNPWHKADWFLQALRRYDVIFTPRRANMDDLRRAGCADVRYLPFAYSPEIHFTELPANEKEAQHYASDVVFAGGADADRLPYMRALIAAGHRVALYGGYWSRHPEMRPSARGNAGPEVLRKAVGAASIALCLVRRANRDGHAMRTYELGAMGACILAEDTEEHRQILGPEGVAAYYFQSIPEMIGKTKILLGDASLRFRLAAAARERIAGGGNTYMDRLKSILEAVRRK